jgi:hypothetical protein
MLNITNLIVDEKVIDVPFKGFPGFSVKLAYLGPERLKKLQQSCTYTKYDRKLKNTVETLDEDIFIVEFSKAVIREWKGFKVEYLEDLMLVEIPTEEDSDAFVDYSIENAEALLRNSTEFLNWINEVVFDLTNFRTRTDK